MRMDKPPTYDAEIKSRVFSADKDQAEKILHEAGLNMSDAIRVFLKQVVLHRGLPFEVKIPNKATLDAFKETDAMLSSGKHDKTYKSFKHLRDELEE